MSEFIGKTRIYSLINRKIAKQELDVLFPLGWILGDGNFSRQIYKVAERRETQRLVRAAKKKRKKK